MTSCKRPVHKTMCESDTGIRIGHKGKVQYESRPKKGHYKPKTGRKDTVRGPSSPRTSKRRVKA